MKSRVGIVSVALVFLISLSAPNSYGANNKINYTCTFESEVDAGQLICGASGTVTFSVDLTTQGSGRTVQREYSMIIDYPSSSCCSSFDCRSESSGSFKIGKKTSSHIRLRTNGARFASLTRPLDESISAALFTDRGTLGLSGGSSVPVKLTGQCTRHD